MPPSTPSVYTSGSSSTGHSSRLSSDSSRQITPTTTTRSETIKPPRKPKPRPQALTQAFQPQAPSYVSQRTTSTSSSGSNPPLTPQSLGAFRAQIHQLMPRHALFHVRVNVQQLASVPFVKGEFGVRWKFKKVKSRKDHRRDKRDKGKGKSDEGNADTDDEEHDHDHAGDTNPEPSGDEAAHGLHSARLNVPSVVISNGHHNTPASAAPIRPASPSYTQFLTSDWLPQSFLEHTHLHGANAPAPPPSLSSTTPQEAFVQGRGMTTFLPLQDHKVTWEQTLNVVVKMDVQRDTMDLLSNELKLVVMQRVIPGDIDAPHNPRLGAVYLNLAEYADAGPVTRRYLLCESKTNATLKVTIELEHVGGEQRYKAPPLPKGEILGGIAGILDNDVYRTQPRALDLYGMHYAGDTKDKGTDTDASRTKPLDIASLSSAYGPRTTETLIEAIFNPVPSHVDKPSPFTYYVPWDEQQKQHHHHHKDAGTVTFESAGGDGSVRSVATSSERSNAAPSFSSRSAHSVSSHGHGGGQGGGGGGEFGQMDEKRRWWRKIGNSRPGTPAM